MALLEIQSLSKRFGGIVAVEGCSCTVEEGSITALIGPNGAGKTTVFNMISGLIKPDEGKIIFEDTPINGLKPHRITRKGVSRTFQISRDLKEMTVLENLVIHAPTSSFKDLFLGSVLEHEREKAMDLLEFVGISQLAEEKAKNLSYGQKKLLEFAATLMTDPKLVLLDEPAGGVNPALLEDILERITLLNERGVTFFIVEHNMDVVMNLCTPVVVMAYGKVIAQGPPREIQNNQEVLKAYLGES